VALKKGKAANELGYHPFPLPAINASAPYLNSEGVQIGACQYCGFCTRFGCEANAKASANDCLMPVLRKDPKFELRTRAYVVSLVYDKAGGGDVVAQPVETHITSHRAIEMSCRVV